jgi:pimeloyl-ACP methyl ester carboxylesterase
VKPNELIAYAGIAAGLIIAATVAIAFLIRPAQAADDPPLMLARDGFFYVNARSTTVDGKDYVSHQMYVEVRIPAKLTYPYPIVMVHGGTMSGTNYTGTPDDREGWAQYFVRQGYAVYVVDQPGRARSGYLAAAYGPMHNVERGNALSRPNLQKMPILVLTAEASYHAPYDHCTVNYLRQAGVKPTYIRLADIGIKGNSHVMMLEKNNKEIAAVLAKWLDETLPANQ